jgi:hypothetical protein
MISAQNNVRETQWEADNRLHCEMLNPEIFLNLLMLA